MSVPARLIAFYLPQFHPIPENDEWWGKGFTDGRTWRKPSLYSPDTISLDCPADLGYYDLRVPEIREGPEAELGPVREAYA